MRRLVATAGLLTAAAGVLAAAPAASSLIPAELRTPRPPRTPSLGLETPRPASGFATPVPRRTFGTVPANPSTKLAIVTQGPDPSRKTIALTLDDGTRPDPRILDLTEQWQVRGTAFLIGKVAESTPWLVRRLVADGWDVCSHTYSHKVLTGLSEDAMRTEIRKGADAVARAAGKSCPYFRPPQGRVNSKVVEVARSLGLTVVNWNATISDSTSESTPPSVQVGIALRTIRPGGILLGHFGGAHSYVVLRQVLETIFAQGYRVGRLSDLLLGTAVPGGAGDTMLTGVPGLPEPLDVGEPRPLSPWSRAEADMPPGGWVGFGAVTLGLLLLGASWAGLRRVPLPVPASASPFELTRF